MFAMNFARNHEKKIINGKEAWWTIHLSQRTSVLYSRLTDFLTTVESGVLMRFTNSKLFLTKGHST